MRLGGMCCEGGGLCGVWPWVGLMLCPVHEPECITMGDLCFYVTSVCVSGWRLIGAPALCALPICVTQVLFVVVI